MKAFLLVQWQSFFCSFFSLFCLTLLDTKYFFLLLFHMPFPITIFRSIHFILRFHHINDIILLTQKLLLHHLVHSTQPPLKPYNKRPKTTTANLSILSFHFHSMSFDKSRVFLVLKRQNNQYVLLWPSSESNRNG